MDRLLADLRFALRMLRRSPAFSAVAGLSLALGIGANTAIFSVLDQVIFRPLPVERPEELVILKSPGPKRGRLSADEESGASSWSYPMYKDLRDRNQVFAGLLARFAIPASVAYQGQTQLARGELVSGNYFDVLGVRATVGRMFTPSDDVSVGGHPLVVLSHAFWTQRFGSDPKILNESIIVNGHRLTVVGIAPRTFFGVQVGETPEVFVPMSMKAEMTPNWNALDQRNYYWLNILGRLKPGVSREQAAASLLPVYRPLLEMEADQLNLPADIREKFIAKKVVVETGTQGRRILRNEAGEPLTLLMGMVGLVLLIACANVANLLVARGVARQREIAVRLAVGASRWQLVRQLLLESLILSTVGGIAGLLIASWTIDGLLHFMRELGGPGLSASMDGRVLAFNFALTLATGLLFGLFPALRTTRPDLAPSLKDQSSGASANVGHVRFRKTLVIGQVALTLLLLVGSGLFAKSLARLRAVDLGMRTDRVVRFSLAPELNGYTPARSLALYQRLQESLGGLPGIQAVSMATTPIFADDDSVTGITVPGYSPGTGDDMSVYVNWVGPGYFSTLGVPLMKGREFTRGDLPNAPKVCLVNDAFAQRFFKGRNPIGYKIGFARTAGAELEIVGVVANSKHSSVQEQQRRFVYTPYMQKTDLGAITFYVRTAQPPSNLMSALRSAMQQLDANLPLQQMKTLEMQIEQSLTGERVMSTLAIAFGILAALLASIGVLRRDGLYSRATDS